ncbi:SAM-dependent methyltransferase [Kitasatospora sp. NPDC053057]|uniref:SAM-dependent methyltransferase n=1 Tax=Kitasatospora sp. NPDC053057 TaxID=3364062 RepID=UPI0037C5AB20
MSELDLNPTDTGRPRLPQGVGLTALGVAVARAQESLRDDRLFDDPYARTFVEAVDAESVGSMRAFGSYIALRTALFDDYLLAAARAGRTQVVVLAAGLDTRALRLDWPAGTTVFELDLPEVLEFKEAVLGEVAAPAGSTRTVVPADLREDWAAALTAAGFHPEAPTAWLAEGLLPYLTQADNDLLLERVGALSAPTSRLAVEHVNPTTTYKGDVSGFQRMQSSIGAQWRSTQADPPGWLAGHGWRTLDAPTMDELHLRYGRGDSLSERTGKGAGGLVISEREA